MKRLLLILVLLIVFAGTANAGTYDHSVQISTGQTVIDSVILYSEVNNTKLDSAKWFSFPVDSFITIPDTAALILEYRFYYKIDSAAGTFRTTSQLLGAVDKTTSVYNNVIGIYAVDTSGTDDSIAQVTITLKDASGTAWRNLLTDADGFDKANLSNGNWTLIGSLNGFVFIDTTINVTADDTLSIKGYNVAVPVTGSSVTATAFGDIRDLTGTLIPNVTVIATLPRDVKNTCDSTWTFQPPVIVTTDASGRFTMTLTKSSCFGDQAYTFSAYKTVGGILQKIKERDVVIPSDSTTFRIF